MYVFGMKESANGLDDNDHPGHSDQGAFDGGRDEFYLSMSIGMIIVPRLGRQMQTVKSHNARENVHNAFESIGENGH